MQKLMYVGNGLNEVAERLQPLGVSCRRREHLALPPDSTNDTLTVGAIANEVVVAAGIARQVDEVPSAADGVGKSTDTRCEQGVSDSAARLANPAEAVSGGSGTLWTPALGTLRAQTRALSG